MIGNFQNTSVVSMSLPLIRKVTLFSRMHCTINYLHQASIFLEEGPGSGALIYIHTGSGIQAYDMCTYVRTLGAKHCAVVF